MTTPNLHIVADPELLEEAEPKSIQNFGSGIFPEGKWREAILDYLFANWRTGYLMGTHPKISFWNVTLQLDGFLGAFYASGHGDECPSDTVEEFFQDTGHKTLIPLRTLVVKVPTKNDVEVGLIRFAKDDSLRFLLIYFPSATNGFVAFSKKQQRSRLGIWHMGLNGDHWHSHLIEQGLERGEGPRCRELQRVVNILEGK